jgi:hypothetical protein
MRRALVVLAFLLVSSTVQAKAGIGLLGGLVFPVESRHDTAWAGAYVIDIPLFSSFHLAPYAELYKLTADGSGGTYVSDVGMGFNFMLRTRPIKPFGGFTVGATPMGSDLRLDVGFQAGLQWKIVSNFSLLFLGRYNIAIGDNGNLKRIHALAGIQFDL